MVDEAMRPGHEIRPPGFDHRQHAFAEGALLRRPERRVLVELVEIFEVRLGKDIARIRKSRHPAAVAELRIPADVVVMQVRAHDEIDLVGARAG
jgi:hypothetical protein